MFTRNKCRWLGVLFVLILAGSRVLAQQPQKTPPADPFQPSNNGQAKQPAAADKLSLEDLITQALKENADIRVSEAKLKEAEAELSRARMAVAQKLIAFHASLVTARKLVEEGEERLKTVRGLAEKKVVSQEELRNAESSLAQKKADLARLEAELPFLLGQSPGSNHDPAAAKDLSKLLFYHGAIQSAQAELRNFSIDKLAGSIPDKVRKALDAPITLKAEERTIGDWLDFFKDKMGVSFLDLLPKETKTQKVTLGLSEPVPMGAALQAFSDLTGLRFAVREYGVLVTKGDLPAGAVPLHSFWKTGTAAEKPSSVTTPAPK